MKKLVLLLVISVFGFTSCGSLGSLFDEPSEAEVLYALRQLLDSSALDAIATLRDLNQQGIGGLLPEEIQPVFETLKLTGAIDDIDKVENTLKDVSATVVDESGIIMKDAVSQVKFTDAISIVLGGKDAATQVLRNAMYTSVKNRYSSKIDTKLQEVDPQILNYWKIGSSAYNLLGKEKVDADLSDFIAERSVDLLFSSMGAKEAEYRENIPSLGDQVVTKVFDYYRNRERMGL